MQILGSGIDLKEVEYIVGLAVIAIIVICFATTNSFYEGLDLTVNTLAPNADDLTTASTSVNQLLGNNAESWTDSIAQALIGAITLIPISIIILIKIGVTLMLLYFVFIELIYKWYSLWGIMN